MSTYFLGGHHALTILFQFPDVINRSLTLCSPTTYRALEAGKPGTSVSILVNALWFFGQIDTLESVAPAPVDQVVGRRVRKRTGQPGAGLIREDERDF